MRQQRTVLGLIALLTSTLIAANPIYAQDNDDREEIIGTALDYLEGWFEGNPERMASAVHDDLAKRIARPTRDGCRELGHMGKETLVQNTARKGPGEDVDLREQIRILDVFGHAAVVRADGIDWIDYLQLAKLDGKWVIVNVLWELYPHASPPGAELDCTRD